MGVLFPDSMLVEGLGLTLSGLVRSFKGSFSIQKNGGQYDLRAECYTYLNQEHYNTPGARPIHIKWVTLTMYEYPTTGIEVLYNHIKEGVENYVDI